MADPSKRRPFGPALRALDAELRETPLPAGSLVRLRSRMAPAPARLLPVLAVSAACAVVLALLGYWAFTPRHVAGFTIATNHDLHMLSAADGTIEVVSGEGVIVPPGLRARLRVSAQARLRMEKSAVRVLAGAVDFTVAPIAHGEAPLRVLVSHGAIEVVGTEFLVRQREGGGDVALRSGSIRFVADGRVIMIRPGETLVWPLVSAKEDREAGVDVAAPVPDASREVAPAREVARPRSEPGGHPRKAAHAVNVPHADAPEAAAVDGQDQLMQELDALRIRGRYLELTRHIAAALPQVTSLTVRESLSYERCDIIAFRLDDSRGACACFAEHLEVFPQTRYATQIANARKASGCE